MSDDKLPRGMLAFVVAAFAVWALALVLAVAMSGCSSDDAETSWPESAEFSETQAGAPRFSWHDTGELGWSVVVDHETGVQYLAYAQFRSGAAVCPLLDADGSPLLVAEAGE